VLLAAERAGRKARGARVGEAAVPTRDGGAERRSAGSSMMNEVEAGDVCGRLPETLRGMRASSGDALSMKPPRGRLAPSGGRTAELISCARGRRLSLLAVHGSLAKRFQQEYETGP
jgi:hypothetical protein